MRVTVFDHIQTTSQNKKLIVKAIDRNQKDFLQTIRANIRALWSGEWDLADFLNAMQSAINYGYTRAWIEGARECGIEIDDLTGEEMFLLRSRIVQDQVYAGNLGLAVEDGSKANGGKLYSFYPRADLWAKSYNELRNTARVIACDNQKLKCIVTAKESCPSCLKLKGKVKRASYWREHDIHPQHRGKLECMIGAGGVPVCRCRFERTDEPISKGPLPNLP